MKKEEITNILFEELMNMEIGHDWGLMDEEFNNKKRPHDKRSCAISALRLESVGGDFNEKKQSILMKAEKLVRVLQNAGVV